MKRMRTKYDLTTAMWAGVFTIGAYLIGSFVAWDFWFLDKLGGRFFLATSAVIGSLALGIIRSEGRP